MDNREKIVKVLNKFYLLVTDERFAMVDDSVTDDFGIVEKKERKKFLVTWAKKIESISETDKKFIKSYRFTKTEIETFLKYINDEKMEEIVIPVIEKRRVT